MVINICLNCSIHWSCDEGELTTEEECPRPTNKNCKDGKCTCCCHLLYSDDPAISVPYKYQIYSSRLSAKEREWSLTNMPKCNYHHFQSKQKISEDGKKFISRDNGYIWIIYSECIFCNESPILCTGCENPVNHKNTIEPCIMYHCPNNPNPPKSFSNKPEAF